MIWILLIPALPLIAALMMAVACWLMRSPLLLGRPVLCGTSGHRHAAEIDGRTAMGGFRWTNALPWLVDVYFAPRMVRICGLGRKRTAVTIGPRTIIIGGPVGRRTLIHEAEHLQQWAEYGPIGFPIRYVLGALRSLSFTRKHPLEHPAYEAGDGVENVLVWSPE